MTHDDVQTLFHEFGHGLHHMLSRVETAGLSGINGVEWDAVEMPSQFMENWAWQYDVIKTISAKDETGEPLPKALFDKMLAAKNFHAGHFCVRQLEFALFDMLLHGCGNGKADFMKVLSDVRKEVAVTPSVPFNRFPQSFSHIFAGATPRATTATSGLKCFPLTPSAPLKRKGSLIRPWVNGGSMK